MRVLKRSIAAVQVDQMMKLDLQIFTPGQFMTSHFEDRGLSKLVNLFGVCLDSKQIDYTGYKISKLSLIG